MHRLLLLTFILAGILASPPMEAEAAPARGGKTRIAGLPVPDGVPALFLNKYKQAADAYCVVAEDQRARRAYQIGWMLIRARQRELARPWLREAARRGHDLAGPVLASLPRDLGDAAVPCTVSRPAVVSPLLVAPAKTAALVRELSPRYDVDPNLVLAVMAVESGYRPDVVSARNAQGLMQLIPDTADRFGVDDVFDPAENIRGGMRYLAWLLKTFAGDVSLALAGYNAGENAVRRYGGIPPYPETQDYVRNVLRHYEWLKQQEPPAPPIKTTGRRRG